MTSGILLDAVALTLGALALYAALVWQANRYSQLTNWQPPHGNEYMNWTLRRNLALTLGCLAVLFCSVCSVLLFKEWSQRLLATGQAVVMAVAGTSDLRRFHLPLPLTLLGFALSIYMIVTQQFPLLVLVFTMAWACAVIVMHALLSKGSMQLGDHLATLWIALASPFNGLLAVAAGDLMNVILARVHGLRGKKVAAAGAWLIVAAALMGLPPYIAWFKPVALADPNVQVVQVNPIAQQNAQATSARTLMTLAQWAGDYTAQVAFVDQREARMAKAGEAAEHVARIARIARHIAPASDMVPILDELAQSLAVYDTTGIQEASLRLSESRLKQEPTAAMEALVAEK